MRWYASPFFFITLSLQLMRVVVVLGFERWLLANLSKKASLKSIHDSIVETSPGRLLQGKEEVSSLSSKWMVLEDYPMKVVVLEGLNISCSLKRCFEVVCGELASPL
ncbi:unnamed protein product [Microthlaspi erraticum]|uniref:Uncharacterized protein n=1 Tax=Microthlaspi erraticum TaxID=1685480 RepID=A0A6D2IYP8_9BRAS|nr:unnamed protein product [Microthlaspi erraticum]